MALDCHSGSMTGRTAAPCSSEAEPTLIAQLFAVPVRHLNTEQLTEKQLTRLQLTSHQLTEESAVTTVAALLVLAFLPAVVFVGPTSKEGL